jgi:hypothetical protein
MALCCRKPSVWTVLTAERRYNARSFHVASFACAREARKMRGRRASMLQSLVVNKQRRRSPGNTGLTIGDALDELRFLNLDQADGRGSQ